MEKLLLRPAEAADALGVSRSKIYELLAARALPVVRVGNSVRVPADVLRQWLQQRLAEQQERGTTHE